MATPMLNGAAVLTGGQRSQYETDGYLALPSFLDRFTAEGWLGRLQAAAQRFLDASRSLAKPDNMFDLEVGHTAQRPRLRRLTNPVEHDEDFRSFALEGPAAQLAMDLLGGPVRFHHSKLNYKASDGGAAIDWHQDIQFWPHSDFSPLTIGVYLADTTADMGPMGVVPASHQGELFDLFEEGRWSGRIREAELERVALDQAHFLCGPAGSVTVHNCCAVHGSAPNASGRDRPLLLQTYSRADAYPLIGVGANGRAGSHSGLVIGGPPPRWIEVGGRRMPAAPDWSRGGYTTIFDVQQR